MAASKSLIDSVGARLDPFLDEKAT
jgi:hypothetical protein